MLDEPGKDLRKAAIELPDIDSGRNRANDVGTAVGLIAAKAVWMTGPEPLQDARPVQEIVHQGVDGNHVSASHGPARVLAAEEQTGQRHRQDLVRYAMDVPQRPNKGLAHGERQRGVHRFCVALLGGEPAMFVYYLGYFEAPDAAAAIEAAAS